MIPLKEKFTKAQEKRNCNKQKALLNSKRDSTRNPTPIYRGETSTGALSALSEHHALQINWDMCASHALCIQTRFTF